MQILDREGLLAVSCSCYEVIRSLERTGGMHLAA
jgi:hypothetical protein